MSRNTGARLSLSLSLGCWRRTTAVLHDHVAVRSHNNFRPKDLLLLPHVCMYNAGTAFRFPLPLPLPASSSNGFGVQAICRRAPACASSRSTKGSCVQLEERARQLFYPQKVTNADFFAKTQERQATAPTAFSNSTYRHGKMQQ